MAQLVDRRRLLPTSAPTFSGLQSEPAESALVAPRSLVDSWAGTAAAKGYDLQLTRYDERGWRATFYTSGMEHSPTSATGTAWEQTPWRAVQRAASKALRSNWH